MDIATTNLAPELLRQLQSAGGGKAQWTSGEWGEVISYLEATLQHVLPIPVRFDDSPMIDTDSLGFCLEFASLPNSEETPLRWEVSGTLGMQCNGSEPRVPAIAAATFFAVNEQPLLAQGGQSYLELHFDLVSHKWVSGGWQMDEFGEFGAGK